MAELSYLSLGSNHHFENWNKYSLSKIRRRYLLAGQDMVGNTRRVGKDYGLVNYFRKNIDPQIQHQRIDNQLGYR